MKVNPKTYSQYSRVGRANQAQKVRGQRALIAERGRQTRKTINANAKADAKRIKASGSVQKQLERQRTIRQTGFQTAASLTTSSLAQSQANREAARYRADQEERSSAIDQYNNLIKGEPDQTGSNQGGSTTTTGGGSGSQFGYGG